MGVKTSFNIPNEEAKKYIDAKSRVLPTDTWKDITQSAHSKAFVIAGISKLELLSDTHAIIAQQMETGTSFSDFRKQFREKVAQHGWTKFETEDRKYQAWRTKIIYHTNMNAAIAAGEWEQITSESSRKNFPYLQYVHGYYGESKNPRVEHKAWDGIVLPVDDPFWERHYPPNGFNCNCGVRQLTKAEGEEILGISQDVPYSEEKQLKKMRKYAQIFERQDANLEKSGWAYNVGINDAAGFASLFKHVQNIVENPKFTPLQKQFADKAWKNISDNSPQLFKDSLKLWNDKYYGNKGSAAAGQNRRVAGIISKERIEKINAVFKEKTGRNLTDTPIISISEKQFEHAVRNTRGDHIIPQKDFYAKIAQALESGDVKYSAKYKGGENSVVIEFENHNITIYTDGIIHTFYEKRKSE